MTLIIATLQTGCFALEAPIFLIGWLNWPNLSANLNLQLYQILMKRSFPDNTRSRSKLSSWRPGYNWTTSGDRTSSPGSGGATL
jgi:hypothetical protein